MIMTAHHLQPEELTSTNDYQTFLDLLMPRPGFCNLWLHWDSALDLSRQTDSALGGWKKTILNAADYIYTELIKPTKREIHKIPFKNRATKSYSSTEVANELYTRVFIAM